VGSLGYFEWVGEWVNNFQLVGLACELNAPEDNSSLRADRENARQSQLPLSSN
jgi:hypothetical protein